MKPWITCTKAGRYPLQRGKQYEMLSHDEEGGGVVIRDDSGRHRWVSTSYFDLSGAPVPLLTAWRFDDPAVEEPGGRDETYDWVDIVLRFDDGSQRWCQMMTADFLKETVNNPIEPMVYSKDLILIRDLSPETVELVLFQMDEQNELIAFSFPFEPTDREQSDDNAIVQ